MNKLSPTARRLGLSQTHIIEVATKFSEKQGIDGWSIRDISKKIGVSPSVIYHYFPNKEALCIAVVDKICSNIVIPDKNLEWKEWFTQLAKELRPLLLRYHGVTDRLARGKFSRYCLPMLDISYMKLEKAGFGEHIPIVYCMIMNSIIHSIGARNLRSNNQIDDPHNLNEMIEYFSPLMKESFALENIVQTFFSPLSNPDKEDELSDYYYYTMIKVVLSGLEKVFLT